MSEDSKTDNASVKPKVSFRMQYFPKQGRGSVIKRAAYLVGIPFIDEFVSIKQYNDLKSNGKLVFAGLPQIIINIDNKTHTLSQSNAILKLIAQLGKSNNISLYPDDFIDAAMVDSILDATEDVINLVKPAKKELDKDKQIQLKKQLLDKNSGSKGLYYWFEGFEAILDKNYKSGFKNGYMVGDSMTIADLKAVTIFTQQLGTYFLEYQYKGFDL